MMKAVKKLKIWSRSKKKRKYLEEPHYPVPMHQCCCCSCSSVQSSAPPLPPWPDQFSYQIQADETEGVEESKFIHSKFPQVDEGIITSRSMYQQYMVQNPVYDMPEPVVEIVRRERSVLANIIFPVPPIPLAMSTPFDPS
ncbi:uncharacterized protein LOC110807395 [Carica papaya]|uniref:uncharacterized protein LOC110807395 n=1 Tax=Carica papaya TaxID=3649 RepID=UPI000B8CB7D1|nr:uncharacterized protein LOC110807395 [Carica papaya]